MARPLRHNRCHTDLSGPQSPSMDLCTMHSWILLGSFATKGDHRRHGQGRPNQSPRTFPGPTDIGPSLSRHPLVWQSRSALCGERGPTPASGKASRTLPRVIQRNTTPKSHRSISTRTTRQQKLPAMRGSGTRGTGHTNSQFRHRSMATHLGPRPLRDLPTCSPTIGKHL